MFNKLFLVLVVINFLICLFDKDWSESIAWLLVFSYILEEVFFDYKEDNE